MTDNPRKPIRFLTGHKIQKQVRKISSRPGDLMAAVAYWGGGAAKRTGLANLAKDKCKHVRIVCDLLSGACSPSEIKELRKLGIQVKKLDRLHAKVWINGNNVVVGSANASKPGLSYEDENSNIEAAVLLKDKSISEQAKCWFEERWKAATPIDDKDMGIAEELWAKRVRYESEQKFGRQFDRLSGVQVVAYSDGLSSEARKEEKKLKEENKLRKTGKQVGLFEWPLEGGPDWSDRSGTIILDFSIDLKLEKVKCHNLWQVSKPSTKDLTKSKVTILERTDDPSPLSNNDREEIKRRVHIYVEKHGYTKDEFGFYIDMSFREFWLKTEPIQQPTLVQRIQKPDRPEFFSDLRLLAYRHEDGSEEADDFFCEVKERQYLGVKQHHLDYFETSLGEPEWKPATGTVFVDFTCDSKNEKFTYNGLWQVEGHFKRQPEFYLTVLKKIPHFHHYRITDSESKELADQIYSYVEKHNWKVDKHEFYINEIFHNFYLKFE